MGIRAKLPDSMAVPFAHHVLQREAKEKKRKGKKDDGPQGARGQGEATTGPKAKNSISQALGLHQAGVCRRPRPSRRVVVAGRVEAASGNGVGVCV